MGNDKRVRWVIRQARMILHRVRNNVNLVSKYWLTMHIILNDIRYLANRVSYKGYHTVGWFFLGMRGIGAAKFGTVD